MASIHDSYIGVAEEVTYGTAVAPARFLEVVSEGLAGKYERIDSEAFRAGQRVLHTARFQPNPKGAEGDLKFELMDGSFGLILKHMLGSIASGAPSGGFTTHTATVGDLTGKSLTIQVGRVGSTGTLHPFTYEGCKIKDWELSCQVDGIAELALSVDAEAEYIGAGAGAYAAATPSYPTTAQLFTFVGGSATIGGVEFAIMDFNLKGDNKLKTDRWFMRGSSLQTIKKEPLPEGLREYSLELKGEFIDLTHSNRVAAAAASGTHAAVVLTFDTPQAGQLLITIPAARFDEGGPNLDGMKVIEQGLKGTILWDGSASPITMAYKSKDAAP